MPKNFALLCALVVAGVLPASIIWAKTSSPEKAPPALKSIFPLGGTQGSHFTATVRGDNLDAASHVWFDCQDLAAEIEAIKEIKLDGDEEEPYPQSAPDTEKLEKKLFELQLRVTVAAAADLGAHEMRLVTPLGVTAALSLLVSSVPVVLETDRSHAIPTQAQNLELPAVVNARLAKSGEVDYYSFDVEAGQGLQLEVRTTYFPDLTEFGDPQLVLFKPEGSWFDPNRGVRLEVTDLWRPPPGDLDQITYHRLPRVHRVFNESGRFRVYLGRRLDCAQCHNHPSDRWTQNQYWGLAAFFGRMTNTGWNHDNVVFDDVNGHEVDYVEDDPELRFREVIHPRNKGLVSPAFLDGTLLAGDRREDPRMELARWMTSHPYFAEAAANRIWSYFFGRGLVDPVDDFRLGNPPTHPQLLEALASRLREQDYDLKHLMRLIVTSRTYQLSSRTNPGNRHDRINYSHALPRPLEPAVLLDAISQVTGVPEVFGKMPVGTKAIELRFPSESSFLDIFGTPQRDVVPEPGGKPSLGQALHMFAGTTFNQKLSKEGGFLARLVERNVSNGEIIEQLHLATLARFPTLEELAGHETMFRSRPRKEVAEDLLWALLTAREFSENH